MAASALYIFSDLVKCWITVDGDTRNIVRIVIDYEIVVVVHIDSIICKISMFNVLVQCSFNIAVLLYKVLFLITVLPVV